MRIVLDTNVLISAFLTGGGNPGYVVGLALDRSVTLLLDARILAEYLDVTSRPSLPLPRPIVDTVLARIVEVAEHIVAPPLKLTLPDPDDRCFVEVAVAGAADAIVTGNLKHFVPRSGKLTVPVLTPRHLLDRLRR